MHLTPEGGYTFQPKQFAITCHLSLPLLASEGGAPNYDCVFLLANNKKGAGCASNHHQLCSDIVKSKGSAI